MSAISHNGLFEIPETVRVERRRNARFPLHEDVTYKVLNGKKSDTGSGTCVNISSSGMLFTTSGDVAVGRTVEVSMNWPALLDGQCPLKFIAVGPVVRSENGQAAMQIDRYEFRTRAKQTRLELVPPPAVLPR